MRRADWRDWSPRGVEQAAASFALLVVAMAEPSSPARARSLLWAASRLCDFALGCGLEPEPAVVLSRPVIERFIIVATAHRSRAARRTLRSNLFFLAKRVLVLDPPPVPLGREASQAPYSQAEIAGYLSLADNQPTPARAMKASGLIALGAGAGLVGADLRLVTGLDVHARSGGVVVEVRGLHPRVVPVRAEMAERAMRSARFAGGAFIVGGAEPNRRNITSRLIASLAGGPDLERLSLARLRATWVARCAAGIGLPAFMAAAGVHCSQRLGEVVGLLDPGSEEEAVALLGGLL
jgi:integrase